MAKSVKDCPCPECQKARLEELMPEKKEETMGQMAVMGRSGDLTVKWNPQNPWETEDAKQEFYRLKKEGYLSFKLDKDGKKGEMINDFDPFAERLVMSPPVRGG